MPTMNLPPMFGQQQTEQPYFGTPGIIPGPGGPPSSGPNFTDRLRMSSIFSGGEGGSPLEESMASLTGGGQYGGPIETPAGDRFSELVGNYPEYEESGMLKKIAASMVALNDPRLAMSILNQPGAESVAWENQIGPAQSAAELEQRRQSQTEGRELERGRLDLGKERLGFDREKFAESLTPTDKHILELEKIDLRGENVLEQIEARAVAARETGDLRQADTLEAIAERGKEARVTAGARGEESRKTVTERERLLRDRPTKTTGAVETQREKRVVNNANEVLARHPEWADYVNLTRDGVEVEEVGYGSFWGGAPELTEEVRQQIVDSIYGQGGTESATAPIETETEVMEKPIPDGSGVAISTDGGKTWRRK